MKGYTQKKKKLIPDFLKHFGNLTSELDWQSQKIPEIIWISYLIEELDIKRTVELINVFSKNFLEITKKNTNPIFPSSFEMLTEDQIHAFIATLKTDKIYNELYISIEDFLVAFPQCPINRIFNNNPELVPDVKLLKKILLEILDPTSKRTTFILGTIVGNSIVHGKLNVPKDSILGDFSEINNYPDTEESRALAGVLKTTFSLYFNDPSYDFSNVWIKYFWNRCYSFEPIKL